MILINGCSFTDGTALKDVKYRYPVLLEKMLMEQIVDISQASKSNFYMAYELTIYLLHQHHTKKDLPRIIIWQHSDCMRDHVVDYHYSATWQPNDIESHLSKRHKFANRFIKIIAWSRYKNLIDERKKLKGLDLKNHMLRHGMGSNICQDNSNKNKSFLTGDSSFIYNEFRHAINIINIQNLCDKLGVKLIHYNYYGTNPLLLTDPVFKEIDRSNYVISNSETVGMYNHLKWKSFNRPDDFHFDESAHYYQANILYNFIVNNTKIEVEEKDYNNEEHLPMYDYVNEINRNEVVTDGEAGRNFLLSLYNKK